MNDDLRPREPALLRDWLAVDRTTLANERTLLAYVRTSLSFFLVGMSFVHLPYFHPNPDLQSIFYIAFGWVLVAVSIGVGGYGAWRFRTFQRRLPRDSDRPASDDPA